MTSQYKLGYQPALNGLRGMAVLLVFLFHCNVPLLHGAFIGVDIFFVLSGFLITILLLEEYKQKGTINFRFFYIRRFLRLGPALLVFLLLYIAVCIILYPDKSVITHHGRDALLVLFYVANITRALDLDQPDILGHCWSLSIEEQFYIFWPLVLLFLLRQSPGKKTGLLMIIFLLPWLSRIVLVLNDSSWNRLYNGFDTRADMLISGCITAMLFHSGKLSGFSESKIIAPLANILSQLVLGCYIFNLDWQTRSTYLCHYSIIGPCVSIIIVNLMYRPASIGARLLTTPVLAGLGIISYGFYLYHYPVIHFVSRLESGKVCSIFLSGGITLLLTQLSWHLVEKKILRLKTRFKV